MLGKLKKVELRTIWKNEEYDFSKWMSEQKNLQLLSDEIGVQLVIKDTEVSVGRYSVDLLATEDGTDNIAVIENQLEITDHDHLGKLLTYAAGLNATYVIWIASDIRDEHLSAIDWLNENTNENVNFFLLKIELWQIDDSKPSPKFTIVAKPNDFSKNIKRTNSGELTETKSNQLEFWVTLQEYIREKQSTVKIQKPQPQHWNDFSLGTSYAHCSYTVNTQDNTIGCELYINDNKDLFRFLFDQKDEIENKIGEKLDWQELENKKASRIKISHEGFLDNKDEYVRYFDWMLDEGQKFKKIFGEYIKKYN